MATLFFLSLIQHSLIGKPHQIAYKMILDFGEHDGTEVKDAPLKYIIFLAGYHMQGAKRKSLNYTEKEWLTKYVKEFHEHALVYLTKRCWHCGRKLVPIGYARKGGARHNDWADRYLHKKCWVKLKVKGERICWSSFWESELNDTNASDEHTGIIHDLN